MDSFYNIDNLINKENNISKNLIKIEDIAIELQDEEHPIIDMQHKINEKPKKMNNAEMNAYSNNEDVIIFLDSDLISKNKESAIMNKLKSNNLIEMNEKELEIKISENEKISKVKN